MINSYARIDTTCFSSINTIYSFDTRYFSCECGRDKPKLTIVERFQGCLVRIFVIFLLLSVTGCTYCPDPGSREGCWPIIGREQYQPESS